MRCNFSTKSTKDSISLVRDVSAGVSLMLSDQQRLGGFKIKRVEIWKRSGEHERSMPSIVLT